jgi:hypothetical protein
MQSTIPHDLSAHVAALRAEMDSLDRGVIEAGLVASRALAQADALEAVLRVALRAAVDSADEGTASFGDPVVAKLADRRRNAEARRGRIAASGFLLIAGGAS